VCRFQKPQKAVQGRGLEERENKAACASPFWLEERSEGAEEEGESFSRSKSPVIGGKLGKGGKKKFKRRGKRGGGGEFRKMNRSSKGAPGKGKMEAGATNRPKRETEQSITLGAKKGNSTEREER